MGDKCDRCKTEANGLFRCLAHDSDGYCVVFQCEACGYVWTVSDIDDRLMDGGECEEFKE